MVLTSPPLFDVHNMVLLTHKEFNNDMLYCSYGTT